MIEVVDLVKSFRDLRRGVVHAVDHVSFEARAGEIFGPCVTHDDWMLATLSR